MIATTVPVVGTTNITTDEKNVQPQSRGMEWNFTYDLGEFDEIRHMLQTTDGGYIGCGMIEEANKFYILLLKLTPSGTEEWHVVNHDLNGTAVTPTEMDVIAFHIIQTSEGGFLMSGVSMINVEIEGTPIWIPAGFLWKTTATGTTQWVQHYYSVEELAIDYIYYTAEIPTGYVSTGHRIYFDMMGQVIGFDGFLQQTDKDGDLQWFQAYDVGGDEHLSSLCNTSDGGYLITGWREATSIHNGALWVVKTNGTGAKQWDHTFDGTGFEYTYGKGCFKTSDNGYIFCGNTGTYGSGSVDAWVIKIDATGNELWNRTFGSTHNDYTWSMTNASNGDYILAICKDYTYNSGTKDDIWIVEINEAGGTEWSYLIEQAETQIPTCIQQTKDKGFIISGRTEEYGTAASDGIAIKIGPFPHLDIEIKGGLGIKAKITNSGLGDATQLPFNLSVNGGILGLINETKNGTIDLLAGNYKSFLGLYMRLGKVTFIVKVAEKEKTVTAVLLGPFVLGVK